ncbi:MAG TPA: CBS domain-containing protein [Kiloniellales bacterium]
MLVKQIFKQKDSRIITVQPSDTVAAAAEVLKRENIGAVMVTGPEGQLAGILSERDIVRAIPKHGPGLFALKVEQLMTRNVVTCGSEDRVHDLMKMMTAGRFRHLPVIDGGTLTGIISIGDVVKSRLEELEAEASQLRDYIASG